MSEKNPSYMMQLDAWIDQAVVQALFNAWREHYLTIGQTPSEERLYALTAAIAGVKKEIRRKVVNSFRAGLKAPEREYSKRP